MKEVNWHHAPLHRFISNRVHMITGATLHKHYIFKTDMHLQLMQDLMLERFQELGWDIKAWACLSNHYHVLALSPEEGDLTQVIRGFHSTLAIAVNKLDGSPGRKVMHQFWDRCITHETSYYARLNYVMNNPVKHGVVEDAETYRFCSARWFRSNQPSSFRRKIASFGTERVNEPDDFY